MGSTLATLALIEYYKLAAGVIPVLWVGNVLQQLSPEAARRQLATLEKRAQAIPTDAQELRTRAAELQTRSDALRETGVEDMASLMEVLAVERDLAALVKEKDDLDKSLDELEKVGQQVKRIAPLAILAALALPFAAVSEGLAFYGVAANRTSTPSRSS